MLLGLLGNIKAKPLNLLSTPSLPSHWLIYRITSIADVTEPRLEHSFDLSVCVFRCLWIEPCDRCLTIPTQGRPGAVHSYISLPRSREFMHPHLTFIWGVHTLKYICVRMHLLIRLWVIVVTPEWVSQTPDTQFYVFLFLFEKSVIFCHRVLEDIWQVH